MEADYIDIANNKSTDDFSADYLPPSKEWSSWIHPRTKDEYALSLHKSRELSAADIESCFRLIELTSSADYKASKDGWKPKAKKREMRLLDMKYILVKRNDDIEGFTSLMPTYEDNYAVVYCYEIHLGISLQGTGLGKVLMSLVDAIAKNIPEVDKLMLTSFRSNQRAVRFYRKLGYDTDEYSPPAKILRDGTKIETDYVILSKPIVTP